MRKMDQIDRLVEKYAKLTAFYGPVAEDRILHAEKQLNMCFPEDYRRFLNLYGAGFFGSFEIYGIVPDPELKSIPNGIWATEDLREYCQLPETYLVIGFDGFGAYYCIDTQKKRNKAAPIVTFVRAREDDLFAEMDAHYVADSFADFILEVMKGEIDFLT